MNRVLGCAFIFTVLSGCAAQPPIEYPLIEAREVIQRPALIQLPENRANFHLVYGNDRALERAFTQYTRTGKAPNIITEGFVKFAYNAGQQPIINATTFEETVISLEPGEKFTNISSGDPNRWSYSVAVSGSGAHLQQNVLVKPSLADIGTNMVITTDRRIYNLRLLSSMKTHPTKTVNFWYPEEMVQAVNEASIKEAKANEEQVATVPDVSLNNLNFHYRLSCGWFCSTPSWSPSRVFDDGTHTYIQFSKGLSNRDMPVLFILNGNDKELVNYRSKPPYFVVDKIFREAVLVMGVGFSQTTVNIKNSRYT